MDQILGAAKKSIDWIDKSTRHFLDPNSIRINANARNVHDPRSYLDHEEHHVPYGSEHAQRFDTEEVTRIEPVPMRR